MTVGLRFKEIADAEVWHNDVHVYSVYDLRSSELLGYFYLDMYSRFIIRFKKFNLATSFLINYFLERELDETYLISCREGKYGHTCVVALQNYSSHNGVKQVRRLVLEFA